MGRSGIAFNGPRASLRGLPPSTKQGVDNNSTLRAPGVAQKKLSSGENLKEQHLKTVLPSVPRGEKSHLGKLTDPANPYTQACNFK